jgi:hypothetical protein
MGEGGDHGDAADRGWRIVNGGECCACSIISFARSRWTGDAGSRFDVDHESLP